MTFTESRLRREAVVRVGLGPKNHARRYNFRYIARQTKPQRPAGGCG